jgi:glycylpeptide N-tetradecanoyltransferase
VQARRDCPSKPHPGFRPVPELQQTTTTTAALPRGHRPKSHTMPQEASKLSAPDATAEAAAEAVAESSKQNAAAESADESEDETVTVEGGEGAAEKKKKSRKRKIKDALTGKGKAPEITSTESPAGGHLSKDQMNQLLESNPALKHELLSRSKNPNDLEQMIRKLNINEMLTGLAPEGKNTKDMASHAFWKTQPVPSFDEMANKEKIEDGPIKHIEIDKVDKNPSPMHPGFEWVTMDLEDEKELDEVYDLLTNHYVEDKDATFRFKYSPSFLNWYVYKAATSTRLTTAGLSKHPAGRKNGTLASAQPPPVNWSPSFRAFLSPFVYAARH